MIENSTALLLAELRALDVHLRVEDGRLRVSAPKGQLTPALEAALVARKAELLHALADTPSPAVKPALTPVARDGTSLRMSFLQERLWILEQLQPGNTAYNLAVMSRRMHGVEIAALQTAIRRLIARHEILRARFVAGRGAPSMQIMSPDSTPVSVADLRSLDTEAQNAALDAAVDAATTVPFELATEAPVRFTIFQTDDRSAALLFSAHHIAMDSWSMGVLAREVAVEYDAVVGGAPERPPLAVQYAEFAHWQREIAAGPGAVAHLQYWLSQLADLPHQSTFPVDFPRSSESAGTGAVHNFAWSPELYTIVRTMARSLHATPYMVLLAAVAVTLTRNTGQADVAIGTPIGTRDEAALEGILGPIMNPLVMRFDLTDDPTFESVVQRARDAVLDGHLHQDVPFEALVQSLNPERSLGHAPLFQVAVVLHNVPDASATRIHGGGAIYDVTAYFVERDGELTGSIEYRADLFEPATIARIEAQLQQVLRSAATTPTQPVSRLPLLSPAASADLVRDTNPAPSVLDGRSVTEQFAAITALHPDRTAVVASDETLTYASLDARSTRVAIALQSTGVGSDSIVALATDRTSAMVVGLLGILKAGASYVPVDVSYPAERVAFMLSDCAARHLVTTTAALATLGGVPLPEHVVRVDALDSGAVDARTLTTRGASSVAYVIHTSGSTGVPKGVRVSQAALSNFLGAMRERPGISADDAVLAVTSLSFDIAILEILLPLVSGARTIIAGRDVQTDADALIALIRTAEPTIIQSTPSGWRLLMQAEWTGAEGVSAIVGGETMPPDLATWLVPRVNRVFNAYGPTETTVWSSIEQLAEGDPITVGRPIANTRIYVLDQAQQVVPLGVPGEIVIGGAGVADGYHRRPELTAEHFLPDPFSPGGRMYRTGDYGRWRPDGRLDHLGRADGQVKVRGVRIETGEIESVLMTHPTVSTAVVGIRKTAGADPRLVAWVRLKDDADCTVSELRRHLRRSLPESMVPAMLLLVDAIPLTPNGKVNRAALPDPFVSSMSLPREFVEPTTSAERLIAQIWSALLGVERIGATDRFFDLGGHSLLAMQAAMEISARAGVRIEPRLLFFRTLSELAALCEHVARPVVAESHA